MACHNLFVLSLVVQNLHSALNFPLSKLRVVHPITWRILVEVKPRSAEPLGHQISESFVTNVPSSVIHSEKVVDVKTFNSGMPI